MRVDGCQPQDAASRRLRRAIGPHGTLGAMRSVASSPSSSNEAGSAWPGLALPPSFDMDLFLVSEGLRVLGKWEGVQKDRLDPALERLRGLGLVFTVLEGFTGHDVNVFFGPDAELVERGASSEQQQRAARRIEDCATFSAEVGRLLGYPPCCVEAFVNGPQQDVPALSRLGGSLERMAPTMLDFFPRSFAPVGFVPCDLGCPAALAHGERVARALADVYGIGRDSLEHALRGVVLWSSGPHFVLFRDVAEVSPRRFTYAGVVTPADDDAFAAVLFLREEVLRTRRRAADLRRGRTMERRPAGWVALSPDGEEVFHGPEELDGRFFRFGA